MYIGKDILHIIHMLDVEKLQISPHLSCGEIWNYSASGEISDFSTSVMHINLKFLHMTNFSPHISFVIFFYKYEVWECIASGVIGFVSPDKASFQINCTSVTLLNILSMKPIFPGWRMLPSQCVCGSRRHVVKRHVAFLAKKVANVVKIAKDKMKGVKNTYKHTF